MKPSPRQSCLLSIPGVRRGELPPEEQKDARLRVGKRCFGVHFSGYGKHFGTFVFCNHLLPEMDQASPNRSKLVLHQRLPNPRITSLLGLGKPPIPKNQSKPPRGEAEPSFFGAKDPSATTPKLRFGPARGPRPSAQSCCRFGSWAPSFSRITPGGAHTQLLFAQRGLWTWKSAGFCSRFEGDPGRSPEP